MNGYIGRLRFPIRPGIQPNALSESGPRVKRSLSEALRNSHAPQAKAVLKSCFKQDAHEVSCSSSEALLYMLNRLWPLH
jgi:hypothetical protein